MDRTEVGIKSIFVGPGGLRSGWRALLFLVLVVALAAPLLFALGRAGRGLPTDLRLAALECGVLAAALGATWLVSRFERRPFSSFGLGGPHRIRNFTTGLAAGFALLSLLIGLLAVAGAARMGTPPRAGSATVLWGAFWAVVFLMVGLAEETISRGYLLYALSRGLGFWTAAVATSVLFGAAHVTNSGESYIGVACAAIIGLVNAYSLRWSGSLWWAIGLHASWDWGETFFYGVSNSGQVVDHHLLSIEPTGPAWLSGGAVGPEGSALVFAVVLILLASVPLTLRRAEASGLERLRRAPAPAGEVAASG